MSDSSKLRAAKGRVTKALKVLHDENSTLSEKKAKALALRKLSPEIMTLTNSIADLLEPAESETLFDEMYELDEKIEAAINQFTEQESSTDNNNITTHNTINKSHLPKLSIPEFRGNILEFNDFIEAFVSNIDQNNLTIIEKFSYLRQSLQGEAAGIISGMSATTDNYNEVMQHLHARYGDRRRRLRAHVQHLIDFQRVRLDTPKSIRNFIDKTNIHIRGLKSLDVPRETSDVFLCELYMSIMPERVKVEWSRLDLDDLKLDNLLGLLEKEANCIELNVAKSSTHKTFQPSSQSGSFHNRSFHTTFSSEDHTAKSQQSPLECPCCSETHLLNSCSKFLSFTAAKRKEFVLNNLLCFNCLRKGHMSRNCFSHDCKHCGRKHHTLLHNSADTSSKPLNHHTNPNKPDTKSHNGHMKPSRQDTNFNNRHMNPNRHDSKFTHGHVASTNFSSSLLPVISIPVETPSGVLHLNALLDTGSERSFIKRSVLPLIPHEEEGNISCTVGVFGGEKQLKHFDLVSVNIESCSYHLLAADTLCTFPMGPYRNLSSAFHGTGLSPCSVAKSGEISILIGVDLYFQFVTGRHQPLKNGLTAIESRFGWTVLGSNSSLPSSNNIDVNFCQTECLAMQRFFDLDSIGVSPSELVPEKDFQPTLKHDKGRYEVNYPWNDMLVDLPDNKDLSLKRMRATVPRLRMNGNLLQYNQCFKEYQELGIIERAPPSEGQVCHYLPHHPVIKEDKDTTKLRIVFDGSSSTSSQLSLNDCMSSGGNLYPNLIGILSRFRKFQIGFLADIEKAFLQIQITQKDRNLTRFFWFQKLDPPFSQELAEYRFTRLVFGLKASPYLLSFVVKHHLLKFQETQPEIVTVLLNSMYVDDLVASVENEDKLEELQNTSIKIFQDMKMNLRKWCSNIQDDSKQTTRKVLGLSWDMSADTLSVCFPTMSQPILTKRQLASFICSIFDPLGFFAPFTVRLKLLLREVWKLKIDWDDKMPPDILTSVEAMYKSIVNLSQYQVPRWLGCSSNIKPKVDIFADASATSYGCVVYSSCDSGRQFLLSRSKLVPETPNITIPRLELLAVVLAAQVAKLLEVELPVNLQQVFVYTDSSVVLSWISSQHLNYPRFIANRVKLVRTLIPPGNWKHVPTSENPADLITRPTNTNKFVQNRKWWTGPETSEYQTSLPTSLDCLEVSTLEEVSVIETHLVETQPILVQWERFSQYRRLLHAFAYVILFTLKSRALLDKSVSLRLDDIQASKRFLIRQAQAESYAHEHAALSQGKQIPKSSTVSELILFLDQEGVVRVQSRLQLSEDLSFEERFPILLSRHHPLTKLIATHEHQTNCHCGTQNLINQLRMQYWIPGIRSLVKSVIHSCVQCMRFKSSPVTTNTAPLPIERIDQVHHAFCNTGIDYFGPIASLPTGEKYYVLLFTCLHVRAIHLELTTSLDLHQFKIAFEKFIGRRGLPQLVWSDNAKTFQSAAVYVRDAFHIAWKFTTPRAPWTGGVWERLVRTVKSSLRHTLRTSKLRFNDLQACLCKIEFLINNRPLSYQSCSPDDEFRALTPNDFLLPKLKTQNTCLDREQLCSNWLRGNRILSQLFSRWRSEYLKFLTSVRSKSGGPELQLGEVVLYNDGSHRRYWPLARVLRRLPGKDGRTRTVEIKVNGKLYLRAARLLYRLEIP